MKMSYKFLALLLSMLALSGCASGRCGKNTGCTNCSGSYVPPAEAAQSVVEPVESVTPEASVELAEESVPAATRRYVSK
jgi:hypothetical protein